MRDMGILLKILIPVLKNKLQDKSEKKFIVLHFMGSHPLYRNRYPEYFENFQADDDVFLVWRKDSKEMALNMITQSYIMIMF